MKIPDNLEIWKSIAKEFSDEVERLQEKNRQLEEKFQHLSEHQSDWSKAAFVRIDGLKNERDELEREQEELEHARNYWSQLYIELERKLDDANKLTDYIATRRTDWYNTATRLKRDLDFANKRIYSEKKRAEILKKMYDECEKRALAAKALNAELEKRIEGIELEKDIYILPWD